LWLRSFTCGKSGAREQSSSLWRLRHQLAPDVAEVHPSVSTAPQTSRKSRRTFVDPTFAANERGKRFDVCLVLRCIPHHARPLGSRSLVHLAGIGGAANDRGKRLVGSWQIQMLQL